MLYAPGADVVVVSATHHQARVVVGDVAAWRSPGRMRDIDRRDGAVAGEQARTAMAHEIERKFLVRRDAWRSAALRAGATGVRIRQGYLSTSNTRSVRVRTAGERATLNVKGNKVGPRVSEFEYSIPFGDALQMLAELCQRPFIEKTRYDIPGPDGHIWEVDEFHAANAGLVVAEIELSHEDQVFAHPPWLGEEVTDDPRYLNTNLAKRPFTTWDRDEKGSRD